MENLTYVKDSRNGQEAAIINDVARFQMSSVGVVSRSDLQEGEWTDYRPIGRSVRNRTDFHEYMTTVAQHAATSGVIGNFTSETRVLVGEGVVMHTSVDGDRRNIGYQLSPEMNEYIPEEGRNENGWYAIGNEMSKVAAFVPDVFSDKSVEAARRGVAEHFPDLEIYLEERSAPSMLR